MDDMTSLQRHQNMQHIRSSNTKPEIILRKALWHAGIHYRKNYAALPGKPDIALIKSKIAIFIDGDFWHARGHQDHPGEQVHSNKEYWRKKLSRNVEHDKEVNDELTELGWVVLRFWEGDIKQDLPTVIQEIKKYTVFNPQKYD